MTFRSVLVVHEVLGIDVLDARDQDNQDCTDVAVIEAREDGCGLQSGGDQEDIWAYNDAGELWREAAWGALPGDE